MLPAKTGSFPLVHCVLLVQQCMDNQQYYVKPLLPCISAQCVRKLNIYCSGSNNVTLSGPLMLLLLHKVSICIGQEVV